MTAVDLLGDAPVGMRRAAAEVATLHRTFRQVRDLVPDPAGITELVQRWASGRPAPEPLPAATRIDSPDVLESHAGLPLASCLASVEQVAVRTIEGLCDGDHAYLAGYLTEAVCHYTRDLRADPLSPRAWAGFALSGRKIFGGMAFRVLDEHAEVAAGLYGRLGSDVDIPALVRWLSSPVYEDSTSFSRLGISENDGREDI